MFSTDSSVSEVDCEGSMEDGSVLFLYSNTACEQHRKVVRQRHSESSWFSSFHAQNTSLYPIFVRLAVLGNRSNSSVTTLKGGVNWPRPLQSGLPPRFPRGLVCASCCTPRQILTFLSSVGLRISRSCYGNSPVFDSPQKCINMQLQVSVPRRYLPDSIAIVYLQKLPGYTIAAHCGWVNTISRCRLSSRSAPSAPKIRVS